MTESVVLPTLLSLLTAVAGGVGAVLRYLLDGWITQRLDRGGSQRAVPVGLWVVNVSGSLMIGLLAGMVAPAHPLALVLGVGLLGGYTTFSSASYDTVRLLQRGRTLLALGNSVGQLCGTVAAAGCGFALARLLGF